ASPRAAPNTSSAGAEPRTWDARARKPMRAMEAARLARPAFAEPECSRGEAVWPPYGRERDGQMKADGIRIVLVGPSHPGNIGAAARAMKNMALSELVLVNPRQFPHPEAVARASGADDVLAAARVVSSLAAALEGCGYVAATTSRDRDQYFRVLDVREAAAR